MGRGSRDRVTNGTATAARAAAASSNGAAGAQSRVSHERSGRRARWDAPIPDGPGPAAAGRPAAYDLPQGGLRGHRRAATDRGWLAGPHRLALGDDGAALPRLRRPTRRARGRLDARGLVRPARW